MRLSSKFDMWHSIFVSQMYGYIIWAYTHRRHLYEFQNDAIQPKSILEEQYQLSCLSATEESYVLNTTIESSLQDGCINSIKKKIKLNQPPGDKPLANLVHAIVDTRIPTDIDARLRQVVSGPWQPVRT